VSSRIRGPGKAAQIPEEGNGSLQREREREGRMGGKSKFSARSAPDPSHSTKMLGKMQLAKKAQ
jgi:hypothetical protein